VEEFSVVMMSNLWCCEQHFAFCTMIREMYNLMRQRYSDL
jgi:hypothetical protein